MSATGLHHGPHLHGPDTVLDWTAAEGLLDHFLGNVAASGIDYHLIAAVDVRTAMRLGRLGLGGRCYMPEGDAAAHAAEGGGGAYMHGSAAWVSATWRKVAAAARLLRDFGVQVGAWLGCPKLADSGTMRTQDTRGTWFQARRPFHTSSIGQHVHLPARAPSPATCNLGPLTHLLRLRRNPQVLVSDVDVMWLADPLPFFAAQPGPGFFVSLDAHASANPREDAGLEHQASVQRTMNTGVWLARPVAGGAQGAPRAGRSGLLRHAGTVPGRVHVHQPWLVQHSLTGCGRPPLPTMVQSRPSCKHGSRPRPRILAAPTRGCSTTCFAAAACRLSLRTGIQTVPSLLLPTARSGWRSCRRPGGMVYLQAWWEPTSTTHPPLHL
jgi:hypothetical protein